MKFSCDSCGAQYLIADEKIGPKGVKVRCKKCSHVIILRPAGWKPTVKKPASVPPPPVPLDSPLLPPVSSDMGVSQEFAALGFDDKPSRAAVRPATLSVGLDVNAAPAPRAETSPFQSTQRSGGSLDDVVTPKRPSSPPTNGSSENGFHGEVDVATALGSSVPPSESDDDEPATRVDSLDHLPQNEEPVEDKKDPLTAVEDLSALAALERAHSLQSKAEADAAADADAFPAFGEVQTETAAADEEDEVPAPVVTAGPEPDPFAKSHDEDFGDPLADMKSSLDDELGAQLGELGALGELGGSLDGAAGFDGNPKTEVSSRPEVVAAREAETMEQPAPELEAARPAVEDPLKTQVDDDDDDADIASELGSAFDQMFGQGGNELEDLAAELGATREPESSDDENRQETRIFDSEAIGQVESEQRIADDEAEESVEEWFVAINDEQVGPLGPDAVLEHWEAGRLTAESLCWKQGMGDWIPMTEVEAFADLPEQEAPAADDEESAPEGPPTLAARAHTEPAATEVAAAVSEPAWRPSAASALASLAAEELASPTSDPAASIPPAVVSPLASQIPPASDALEKLLGGDPPSETARFGAAEQSESLVRPLPRRADTVSSMPLRDPVPTRRGGGGNNWVVPAAILGGFLLLGLFVLGGIYFLRDNEPPEKVAQVPPAAAVEPPAKLTPPPASDSAALAALAAPSGTSGPSGASGVVAASGASGPSGPSGDVVGKAVTGVEDTQPDEVKTAPPKKKRTRTRRPKRTTRRAPPPEAPPPPPPPRAARRDTTDDLLNPTSGRRRPTAEPPPSLPRKLDDSDVLGVLRKNRRDITRCRDKQTSADATLDGTMTVDFVILKSGRPKRVGVSPSKFRSSVVGKCVVSAVKKWRFPKFSGPSMPLDFPVTIRGR